MAGGVLQQVGDDLVEQHIVGVDKGQVARHLDLHANLTEQTVETPHPFAHELFEWLGAHETDLTLFFRALSTVLSAPAPTRFPEALRAAFYSEPSEAHLAKGLAWVSRWWRRARDAGATAEQLNAVNPKYVLRNYLAQEAIDAAHAGDDSKVRELYEVMQRPFDEQPGKEAFAKKRPEWARSKPGSSALSCSS